MKKTLAEIAEFVGGQVDGDASLVVTGLNGIKEATSTELTFLANPKYFSLIKETDAPAIIVAPEADVSGKAFIRVKNPSLAFAKAITMFRDEEQLRPKGIAASAEIAESAQLADNVAVGANVVIEEGAKIGKNTAIFAGCYIGQNVCIGEGCIIYPNVTLRDGVEVCNRVIVQPGAVIGADGYGYEQVDGRHVKIPQIGTVLVEDDVEIGANVTIDRARFGKTIIGKGTKIDNLVHIAHNVTIGENCLLVAQVGISGSVNVEDNVILAGQAGVSGHLTIGANSVAAAQTGIIKSCPPNSKLIGFPARPHADQMRVWGHASKLPEYTKIIKELQQRIEQLEKKIKE